MEKHCSIPGCPYKHFRQSFCSTHYKRWKKHGDANYVRPRSICKVDECERSTHSKEGYCLMHWKRWSRTGDPLKVRMAAPGTWVGQTCSVDGCDRDVKTNGLCGMHGHRVKRHGDPSVKVTRARGERTEEVRKQQHKESNLRYRKSAHGKASESFRRRARKALGARASTEDINALRSMMDATHCLLCGNEYDHTTLRRKTVDHIHPIKHGGPNQIDNIRVICQSCNSRKQASWPST